MCRSSGIGCQYVPVRALKCKLLGEHLRLHMKIYTYVFVHACMRMCKDTHEKIPNHSHTQEKRHPTPPTTTTTATATTTTTTQHNTAQQSTTQHITTTQRNAPQGNTTHIHMPTRALTCKHMQTRALANTSHLACVGLCVDLNSSAKRLLVGRIANIVLKWAYLTRRGHIALPSPPARSVSCSAQRFINLTADTCIVLRCVVM